MFDDGDAEKLSDVGDRIPDGVYDATSYAQILSDILGHMKNLDPERAESNISFMMKMINLCYIFKEYEEPKFIQERAEDTITALSYYVMNLIPNVDPELLGEFFKHQEEETIPKTFSECIALPIYDLTEELEHVLEMLSPEEDDGVIDD